MRNYYSHFIFFFLVRLYLHFFPMWFCVLWHFGGFYVIFSLHFLFVLCVLVLDFVLWLPLCLCKMSHTYSSPFASHCCFYSPVLVQSFCPFYNFVTNYLFLWYAFITKLLYYGIFHALSLFNLYVTIKCLIIYFEVNLYSASVLLQFLNLICLFIMPSNAFPMSFIEFFRSSICLFLIIIISLIKYSFWSLILFLS